MATQVQTVTDGVQEQAKGATDRAEQWSSTVLSTIDNWALKVKNYVMSIVDRFFPPEQRAAWLAKLQQFVLANPKLSTFLGMNIAITGIPLFLFVLLTLTVFIFSLIVGVVLGVLAAVLFTLFMVGIALTVVLPFVFFTTATACFLFLWGLGTYKIVKWANARGDTTPEAPLFKESIGDSINNLVGGRLTGLMDAAKKNREAEGLAGFNDEHLSPKQGPHGTAHPESEKQNADGGSQPASGAEKVTKATGLDDSAKKATNARNVVSSAGGATGLA